MATQALLQNISVAHQQTADFLRKYNAWSKLTPADQGELTKAFQAIQANVDNVNGWKAVGLAHELSARLLRKGLLPKQPTPAMLNELAAHFQRISSWIPNHGNVFSDVTATFGSVGKAIASVSKDVVTSPVWKVAAGAAAFIPGIGLPLSAGMIGAAAIGKATSVKDGIMSAAKTGLDVAGQAGFDIGTGLAVSAKGMTGDSLAILRDQLPNGSAKVGFDAALSLHVGRTTGAQAPASMPNNAKAAYYATHGLATIKAPADMKKAVVANLTKTPGSAAGVHEAVNEIAPQSWLQWLVSEVKKGFNYVVT